MQINNVVGFYFSCVLYGQDASLGERGAGGGYSGGD
jgi:hypothetical protein